MGVINKILNVSEIVIGERYRRDKGDIPALAASMRDRTLLQSIGVRRVGEQYHLVLGERRLLAAKHLGWQQIECRVFDRISDALEALRAERDENLCRKDFTPAEAVAIGLALEELEAAAAKERQTAGLRRGGKSPVVENFHNGGTPAKTGKTRDIVGEAVGMSGKTYAAAKSVVANGTPELVEAMDQGKVSISTAAEIAELPADEQTRAVVAKTRRKGARRPKAGGAAAGFHELDSLIGKMIRAVSNLDEVLGGATHRSRQIKAQVDDLFKQVGAWKRACKASAGSNHQDQA